MNLPPESTYIYNKIESIESRLEGHVSKIEQRLDQLVHIMQAVAALQEKETRNADSIRELKVQLKESVDAFTKTVTRIHDRLDNMEAAQLREHHILEERDAELERNVKSVDDKIDKWINRAAGLWMGLSAIIIILQGIGGVFLSSFKEEYQITKVQINDISKRQTELEQDHGRLSNTVRQLHPPAK
jgi:DNA repair exonuclease SbcCD ATPase subunit